MLESLVIQRFFVFNIKIVKEINPFRPVDKTTCPNEWAGRYDFLVHVNFRYCGLKAEK